jgi:pterin-4a-carbinolamine dehydratase
MDFSVCRKIPIQSIATPCSSRPGRIGRFPRPKEAAMPQPHEPAPPAAPAVEPRPITEPLKAERIQLLYRDLHGWDLRDDRKRLQRTWTVPGLWVGTMFAGCLAAVVEHFRGEAVITVAPEQVRVALGSQAVGGLTERDFRIAAALEFGQ